MEHQESEFNDRNIGQVFKYIQEVFLKEQQSIEEKDNKKE